ncbi:long-chain fatty acid--CoA ligase [Sulfuriflexus mobilis]|uniref:AMP-dependent synthetase/ligase n=1 Tax=Sulfuriflexus mobilis TaxID=1811807 RepID=UPI0030B83E25
MMGKIPEYNTHDLQLDVIGLDEAGTLPGLFQQRVARTPDSVAYRQYDADDGVWKAYTWKQVADLVAQWQQLLANEELAVGDRVAILLPNSVEWVCFDQAALALGLVVVPLYTTDTPDNIAYILADAGTRLLLLATPMQWLPLATSRTPLPALRRVLCLSVAEGSDASDPILRNVPALLEKSPGETIRYVAAPDELATIIYTSGTTGRPKGVMLSHRNILWNTHAVLEATPAYRDDVFLSFLPLSHAFERTVGYYLPMMAGSSVAYARSVQALAEDLVTIRPTVLVSVPRIYERVYAKIQEKLAGKGRFAQALFRQAITLGWRHFEAAQGRGSTATLIQRLLWPLLRHLVADKIMARLGGRIRIAVSGGAPLTEPIARFFIGLGLPLLQGYGLTEAAPVVSGNRLDDNMPSCVGPPLPGVEIMLGAENELLLRSPGLMLGYWQRSEATQATIDKDGWLHTGDVAELVDGHICIRGRLKEIIVMSTGEKTPPADLELAITLDPLFEQAMVVGEGRPYLGALLVLNPDAWRQLAVQCGLRSEDPASLQASVVHEAVLARLAERCLLGFPHHAQVHAVCLTQESWTIENGLITPTMKLKRAHIEKRFVNEIQEMYAGHTTM